MTYTGPQDDGITKAPGRHYCHPFYGKRFDETQGVPPGCTDVDPETGVCGMCGSDMTAQPPATDRDTLSNLRSVVEKVLAAYEYLHDQDCHTRYGGGMSCSCWQGPLRTALAAQPPATDRDALAEVIWTASRDDEGTISATGANHVADAVLAHLAARPAPRQH